MLLQVRADARDRHANAPVALRHAAAKHHRGQDHERHHGQHDRGEQRAQGEHNRENEHQDEHVAQDRHQARCKQVVEHVDVGSHAGDQAADRVAVVEAQVQPLEMRHQLAAEVEHGELADVLHEVDLAELEQERAG